MHDPVPETLYYIILYCITLYFIYYIYYIRYQFGKKIMQKKRIEVNEFICDTQSENLLKGSILNFIYQS